MYKEIICSPDRYIKDLNLYVNNFIGGGKQSTRKKQRIVTSHNCPTSTGILSIITENERG
jgi:hypothetical protein